MQITNISDRPISWKLGDELKELSGFGAAEVPTGSSVEFPGDRAGDLRFDGWGGEKLSISWNQALKVANTPANHCQLLSYEVKED